MLLLICFNDQAFSADRVKNTKNPPHSFSNNKQIEGIAQQISLLCYEIEAMENGTSQDNIQRMTKWLNLLEAKLLNKIRHTQARLEMHQKRFNETEEEESVIKSLKKIDSCENRIKVCQELLVILGELKLKLIELSVNFSEASTS